MDKRYYVGFWNYVETGELDNRSAVEDWKKMGMNLPMSWEYIDGQSDKAVFTEMLDLCVENGMKVIVCDSRTRWAKLTREGEEAFTAGVKAAVADFGSHPAVFGFHIGDEPGKKQMPDMIKAYRIVKKLAPSLTPFVNQLPYWEDYADAESYRKHVEFLDDVVKKSGMEVLCYDYYGQMATNEKERLLDLYFKNLNLFHEVAEKNGIPLWTTLLSTAHYNSKTLTEDDIMWQIASAVAHGCHGILWFYIYFSQLVNGSYRNYPIANYSEEKEYGDTFFYLSRQNRIFLKRFASRINGFNLSAVRHYNVSYGFTKLFVPAEFEITDISIIVNKEAPLVISRFVNDNNEVKYILLNNDREKAVKVQLHYSDKFTPAQTCRMQAPDMWLAPGQMTLIDIPTVD